MSAFDPNLPQTHSHDTSDCGAFEFKTRDSSDFWFSCVDFKVVWDRKLSMCAKMVFTVICTHVNVRTRDCPLRVKTIAEEAGCSVRSVQESLKALVERGVVERTERFENGKQKASIYKIVGHRALCYRGAYPAPSAIQCTPRGAGYDTPSLRESNTYKIKYSSPSERGTDSPQSMVPSERINAPRLQNSSQTVNSGEETNLSVIANPWNVNDVLTGADEIPPAMRESVDYFLLKTGRDGIQPEELSAVRALNDIHTPGRVNREIAQAAERFKANGRSLSFLSLVYIYKSLQYQNSLKKSQSKPLSQATTRDEIAPDPYEGGYL